MRRNTSKSAKSALTNTYTHNSLNQLVGRDVPSNGNFYFPAYDNNGNITKYIDESGNVVATYEYDDFGRLISATGQMADFFRIRFSTKYFDPETGLYYYGYRVHMRWLNRDPIEEQGGKNLFLELQQNLLGVLKTLNAQNVGTPPQPQPDRDFSNNLCALCASA